MRTREEILLSIFDNNSNRELKAQHAILEVLLDIRELLQESRPIHVDIPDSRLTGEGK